MRGQHSLLPSLAVVVLCACVSPDSAGSARRSSASPTAPAALQSDPRSLVQLVNDYRIEMGLAPVRPSPALDLVARRHVDDLERNAPATGVCNLHSWSDRGPWAGCCYTADQAQAECMLEKPREITRGVYESDGYEIAYSNSTVTPSAALNGFKSSPPHLEVILNQDDWQRVEWHAVGAAVSAHYAVVWFGEAADTMVGS